MDISYDAVKEELQEECDGFLPSVSWALVAERLRELGWPHQPVKKFRKRVVEPEIPAALRARVFIAYGSACVYCGRTTGLDLDFLVPVVREGKGIARNLVVACSRCKESRGTRHLDLWFERRFDLDSAAIYARIARATVLLQATERPQLRRAA